MRKQKKEGLKFINAAGTPFFISTVENFKRRRALGAVGALDLSAQLFFERMLSGKKFREREPFS